MTRILIDALRERGYLNAAVTPRPELEHAPERATLVFTIDPGPRTTIGDVEIVGVPTVTRAELLSRLGLSTRRAVPARGAEQPHRDATSPSGAARATTKRRIEPVVRLSADQRIADLTLTVAPGPRVRVVFTGDPLPADERAELVPVEREGSVDEDLLEDSSNRIEEYLRGAGLSRREGAAHARGDRRRAGDHLRRRAAASSSRSRRYEISGNASVPLAEFEPSLRLRDGQPFSAARLDADVADDRGSLPSPRLRRGAGAAAPSRS